MANRVRRTVECRCCDRTGPLIAHGWVKACYRRWQRAGKPAGGPPPPRKRGPNQHMEEDVAEFAMVLRTRPDITLAQAAAAVGRCRRTGERYKTRLRQMAEASP